MSSHFNFSLVSFLCLVSSDAHEGDSLHRNEARTGSPYVVQPHCSLEKVQRHGPAGVSLPQLLGCRPPCCGMGIHPALFLVSWSPRRRVQVHHLGADAETGAGMLPSPTQGLFWLHYLLNSFSRHSPLGPPGLHALGSSSGLPQTLSLPQRDAVLTREWDTQGLWAGRKGIIWFRHS